MPRRKRSKSQAIREAFEQNPKASAKDIVELLAAKKVRVKPGLVYMVKGKMSQIRTHKKQRAARVARASEKTGMSDPVGLIVSIKKLAIQADGMDNLKALVSVLSD